MAAARRRVTQPSPSTGVTDVNWDMLPADVVAQVTGQPVAQPINPALPPVEPSFEPTTPAPGDQNLPAAITDPNDTLTNRILTGLRGFGIGDATFASEIATAIADGRLNENSGSFLDDVGVVLSESTYLKTRFPANVTRKQAGLQPLPLSEILGLENGYITAMQAANLPAGFYDDPQTDLQNLIARNVSVAEVQRRINQGYSAVRNADPEIRRQFKELYGVDDGTLAAYFLDPVRMEAQLTSQMESAQLAAEARRVADMQLTTAQAEALQQAGISTAAAREGFGAISEQQGLFQGQMAGEQAISTEEQIAGTFGTSAAAAQRIAQRRRQRQAAFETGGGFSQVNQYGISGLGTAAQ
jgi:hypothetical protein